MIHVNRLPTLVRQHIAAFRALLVFTVLCGIIYPVVMVGVAQVAFKNQADGSLVTYNGKVVGSSLLCQEFVDAKGNPLPQYFQPRPSNASSSSVKNDYGCDAELLRCRQPRPEQHDPAQDRPAAAAADRGVRPREGLADPAGRGHRARASGLDPDISPQYAAIQVTRVAAARHLPVSQVQALVSKSIRRVRSARDVCRGT